MSVKARGIEALVGAALGTAGGTAAGALAYKPSSPLEWMDEGGYVRSRALSSDEKAARRSLLANAALVGAGIGTAASLGGGLWRFGVLAKAERDGAAALGHTYLSPLKAMLERASTRYAGLATTPAKHTTRTAKKLKKRIGVTEKLLKREEGAVRDLLSTSRKNISDKPWGGVNWTKRRGEAIKAQQPGSHHDLVRRHFDSLAKGLAKDVNMPERWRKSFEKGFTMSNRRNVFEVAVSQGMRKKAFVRELEAIRRAA